MLSPSFKDDLRFDQCITSVVFEDDFRVRVSHLVSVITNFTHRSSSFKARCNPIADSVCVFRIHHEDHAHTEIEGTSHLSVRNSTSRLNPIKLRQRR